MRKQANIGTTSLILIFVILCLSTFSLLSLSSAKGDLSLAEKNAKAVQAYYEADAAGETFVQMVHQVFREAKEQKLAGARREDYFKEKLGSYYLDGLVQTDIGMEFGQALHIELRPEADEEYRIQSWYVYNREEYEIDRSMPVWTGEMP